MWKTRGYAPGVDGPEARDVIAEAGRIARGESLMIAANEHLTALADVTAELLAALLEDYDSLQDAACEAGLGSHQHIEISGAGRALLARLTGDRAAMPPAPSDPRD